MRSVIPVALRAAAMTKTEATTIAGSLEKPDNASAGVKIPVMVSASSASSAAMSMRNRSVITATACRLG